MNRTLEAVRKLRLFLVAAFCFVTGFVVAAEIVNNQWKPRLADSVYMQPEAAEKCACAIIEMNRLHPGWDNVRQIAAE